MCIGVFGRIQDCWQLPLQNWCGKSSRQVCSTLCLCATTFPSPFLERTAASKGWLAIVLRMARKARDLVNSTEQTCVCIYIYNMTQVAEPAECLLEWQCSRSFGGPRLRCYLGAAHGIAGILHTLLQLPAELALVIDSVRLSKTIKTCQGCQLCWGLLSSSIIHCYPLQSGFQ